VQRQASDAPPHQGGAGEGELKSRRQRAGTLTAMWQKPCTRQMTTAVTGTSGRRTDRPAERVHSGVAQRVNILELVHRVGDASEDKIVGKAVDLTFFPVFSEHGRMSVGFFFFFVMASSQWKPLIGRSARGDPRELGRRRI